ncbi:MAG: acyl transferase [Microcystis sp. M020S1]|nr:acyl transferase [Microcystis sp. M020S1]
MTLFGRIVSLFPLTHSALIVLAAISFLHHPSIGTFVRLVFVLYLLPPLLLRLYFLKYPSKPGKWILNRPTRCDWWIAHQLQLLYGAIPSLEAFLRFIPSAYSAWLRLWGSKVGKDVYWTPRVEIIDRHMMRIGDNVVFGHRVICTSHIIAKKPNGDLVLILRPIRIGSGALIGAGVRIGVGVHIPEKSVIPYNAEYRFRYVE